MWVRSGAEALAWRDESAQLSRVQLDRPTYEVFRNRTEFARYLHDHVEAAVPVPPIDFERELAVLFALGPRSSTGYEIDVESVTEQRGRVVIVARERSPRLGQAVDAHVDYPLRLIVLRDVGKPVAFKRSG
ncbi:MAG TPA: protease complex subunit PrcB family protein [Gaiellaceae bacterium]|nr:protease complex subunit PrcB family protein [Gaiellaceae bacterium]